MTSNYLPTYRLFPVKQPDEFNRVLVQTYTDIANAANLKENGQYELIETQTCQQFYHDPPSSTSTNFQIKRFVFRKCIETGPIPQGAVVFIPHNIPLLIDVTHIYGTVETDIVDWRPLPYVGQVGTDLMSIRIDATDLIIESGATFPNVLSGRVIIEYFKEG